MRTEKIYAIYQDNIKVQAQPKATELGVEFEVKFSIKEGMHDYLVRVKQDVPKTMEGLTDEDVQAIKEKLDKINEFVDHIAKIIVPEFSNDVRFTYPSRL